MQGNLSQINFTDLLMLATGGKKSGVLKLNRGKEAVEIFFTSGNIVHANCPIGEGEKAVLYPVTWDEGTFSLHCRWDSAENHYLKKPNRYPRRSQNYDP